MDAQTQEYLHQHPIIDRAVESLVRLAREAQEQQQHGKTGVLLEFKSGAITMLHEVREFSHVNNH